MRTLKLDMSTVIALYLLLSEESKEFLTYLRKNHPSYCHLDWSNAKTWIEQFSLTSNSTFEKLCIECCNIFISNNPVLKSLVFIGRGPLVSALSDDERQVFHSAKLLDTSLSLESIAWWDSFRQSRLSMQSTRNIAQGRKGELWTYLVEQNYLLEKSTDLKPKWVALDSDRFGYDVASFQINDKKAKPILLEVKTFSQQNKPIIYITRFEWLTAMSVIRNYYFEIWCIENRNKIRINAEELIPYLPREQPLCEWQSVKIDIGPWWTTYHGPLKYTVKTQLESEII